MSVSASVSESPAKEGAAPAQPEAAPEISFRVTPDRYRHWKVEVDGEVATVILGVDQDGGLVPGYELKMNSYDLGVDIELYDIVQRLRFEHPEVKSVVMTSGLERMFCAGANIRMLAQSSHAWKVNFCKFTNETRNGIEDATANSGQTWIAALNGTAAGGGYELALACEQIVLIDDGSSAVSLPEVPLLGVLPGTGGLTRVVDKRHVRKDRADIFATKSEGFRGATAVEWGLADFTVPRAGFADEIARRAHEAAATSPRPSDAQGMALTPLDRKASGDSIIYPHVTATIDRAARIAEITVHAPVDAPPADAAAIHAQGADYWPLAVTRALDDLILHLRTNEQEIGSWLIRAQGDSDAVLAYDAQLTELADNWLVNEIRQYYKRTLKRLDVTSRSIVAVIEPGTCFAGLLLELALAADRQYILEGVYQDVDPDATPATIVLSESNFGPWPMSNDLTRIESRFWGHYDDVAAAKAKIGEPLDAAAATELGLVTLALDDIDFADELRIVLEERAALSPDALTGMEANHRFVGPETTETKIFGRLTAWQNWIFIRPNASGPDGALRRFGTGRKGDYNMQRI
ncbi:2,3-epoxybenzoyl-CoA dihydrolase [Actinacidiphila oryziradicis]|uniref:Benzoyl-CoA-dihydrodiol lyase n=1 Tax=Actinacidiphila oryziradicis TaxID=2571141 RepID=A0A4U0S937_9ACTN|nr:2,3-epoxybenzoyl-CoA dihydrolase [Actinacidiphila oryziradicis]TKA04978.1 benzoyl-CoA-dihydrodiol lyase [Actinacidiphila oryziradicis]